MVKVGSKVRLGGETYKVYDLDHTIVTYDDGEKKELWFSAFRTNESGQEQHICTRFEEWMLVK